MKLLSLAAALVAFGVAGGCAGPTTARHPSGGGAIAPARTVGRDSSVARAITSHVIVISVDGLRPDAIATYGAQTIGRLEREGATSLEARTILPSLTLPSHASMLTGVEPSRHGITWNDDDDHGAAKLRVPTIFALAHDAGLTTAAFFGKSKLRQLEDSGAVDHAESPPRGLEVPAERIANDLARYLASGARPNLLFVHLSDPDRAGHSQGWLSPAYESAVERIDIVVETLGQAADSAFGRGAYTVILTADHGGHGRSHGTADARDSNIPWIAWGKGVEAGRRLAPGIHTTDTAATALWLLGIAVPSWMTGRPVVEAFKN
jgi:predicted AlkP superfamily pyrophosphatase or phosphodiesterase